jgi:hypothetical protein
MSKSNIQQIYNEFKYANGPAQFVLFGLWTIISSGLFPLSGYLPLLTFLWMLSGIAVIASALTLNRRTIRITLLGSVSFASITGSIFFSYALIGGDNRADMQTATIALITLMSWGLYLGNLCSRQLWEKVKK